MKKRVVGAFVFAVVVSAALLADRDPAGATCFHFPLITVCCDGGGCYIVR